MTTLTGTQVHDLVLAARGVTESSDPRLAWALAERVLALLPDVDPDDATFTVCDGCTRSVLATDAHRPGCGFLTYCPDCASSHYASCRVCDGA
jgi:hypothetical protein